MTARRYCFTLNNYTDEHCRLLMAVATGTELPVRYVLFGREVGESGTPHLQGYVEFGSPVRITGAKRLLGINSLHLERACGTASENLTYCSKQDPNPYQSGTPGHGSGHRSDLDSVYAMVKSGSTFAEISEHNPGAAIRYSRGIERLINVHATPRQWITHSIWRYGTSGAGKSRDTYGEAERLSPGGYSTIGDVTLQWFDGFVSNSRAAILDEFDGTAKLPTLLRVLDRYPMLVPFKGGFMQWNPRYLLITSQFSPEHYYGSQPQWGALIRRLRDYGVVIEYSLESEPREFSREHWQEQWERLQQPVQMGIRS